MKTAILVLYAVLNDPELWMTPIVLKSARGTHAQGGLGRLFGCGSRAEVLRKLGRAYAIQVERPIDGAPSSHGQLLTPSYKSPLVAVFCFLSLGSDHHRQCMALFKALSQGPFLGASLIPLGVCCMSPYAFHQVMVSPPHQGTCP